MLQYAFYIITLFVLKLGKDLWVTYLNNDEIWVKTDQANTIRIPYIFTLLKLIVKA